MHYMVFKWWQSIAYLYIIVIYLNEDKPFFICIQLLFSNEAEVVQLIKKLGEKENFLNFWNLVLMWNLTWILIL